MRDNLDAKDALIPTSLFLDFLLENGLNVWKGDSTRDLVAISFGYGSRSYDQEIGHLNKLLKEAESDERRVKIQQLIDEANKNKDKYIKISKQELRKKFYTEGVDITYKTHNKAGQVIKTETLHYKMLYRTPGRAKKGDCVFISDRLYDKAHEFLYMGLRLPYDNAPIVEIGAYASLVTSSIVGRIKIEPENIVILKDVVVPFTRNVISIEVNDRNECEAIHRDNYTLKNEEFDGQAALCEKTPLFGFAMLVFRRIRDVRIIIKQRDPCVRRLQQPLDDGCRARAAAAVQQDAFFFTRSGHCYSFPENLL